MVITVPILEEEKTLAEKENLHPTLIALEEERRGEGEFAPDLSGGSGGNSDYAFFDMKKFEKATDGNLWAGSQQWKKKPTAKNKDKNAAGKKTVMHRREEGT